MGISSSLNASVSGLSVNSSRLAAIADNIANSGTVGYKRAVVDFASVVTGQGGGGTFAAGGVRSTSSREVETNGALLTTANATDLAIDGGGLLPVTPVGNREDAPLNRPLQLLPTGSFSQDDEGFLVTSSGLQLLGYPTDTLGNLPAGLIRSSGVSLEPVQVSGIQFASDPTSQINLGLNLPVSATSPGSPTGPGAALATGVEYFDALGIPQTLTFTFEPLPAGAANTNQWQLTIADSASAANPLATSPLFLEFASTGAAAGQLTSVSTVAPGVAGFPVAPAATLYDPTTGDLTLNLPHGNVTTTIGALNQTGPLTQFDSAFNSAEVVTDGSPVGTLTSIEINSIGQVEAIYDTGFRQIFFQVPVASVPNPNGLTAVDNQAFEVSPDSGNVFLFDAGQGPVGSILGFALEQSAVDVAAELTQLIETQRAYSSNANVVRTVDEILQETTGLIR